MADSPREYPKGFRKEMVGLVRSGRSAESLARRYEPSAQSIRNSVRAADLAEGRRLRKENLQLRMELKTMAKAAAWFARETGSTPSRSSGS